MDELRAIARALHGHLKEWRAILDEHRVPLAGPPPGPPSVEVLACLEDTGVGPADIERFIEAVPDFDITGEWVSPLEPERVSLAQELGQ